MDDFLSRDVVELTLRVCEGLSVPRALTVAIMVRWGEWDALASLECNPDVYLTAEAFAKAQAATSFLRKCVDLPTTFDRPAKARENFWKGEYGCYLANERLSPLLPEHSAWARSTDEARLANFFARVRKRVSRWIGSSLPPSLVGRHGPGATFADREDLTTVFDKMASRPTFTRDVQHLLPQWGENAWGRAVYSASRPIVEVPGNRFSTVPKDATKHRGIAAEPSINVFYQLAVGTELRSRLKEGTRRESRKLRFSGWDLDSAQDIHKQVACEASIRGHRATLDLSNASDSVCRNLVKLCIPSAWFELMDLLRSPRTRLTTSEQHRGRLGLPPGGGDVVLEKFSSMGNGFTFELETIIFAALCCEALTTPWHQARLGEDVYVFGDDIIIPTYGVRSVTAVLRFCGLELNRQKSFSKGSFRESCGGDYFAGKPVRGYFLEEQPYEPQHWISTANGLRALACRLAPNLGASGLLRAWLHCLDCLPSPIRRCRGPVLLGDIVIHDDERHWQTRWRGQIRYLQVYRPARYRKVPLGFWAPNVQVAGILYLRALDMRRREGRETLSAARHAVVPRDGVTGYKIGWTTYS